MVYVDYVDYELALVLCSLKMPQKRKKGHQDKFTTNVYWNTSLIYLPLAHMFLSILKLNVWGFFYVFFFVFLGKTINA